MTDEETKRYRQLEEEIKLGMHNKPEVQAFYPAGPVVNDNEEDITSNSSVECASSSSRSNQSIEC